MRLDNQRVLNAQSLITVCFERYCLSFSKLYKAKYYEYVIISVLNEFFRDKLKPYYKKVTSVV